MGFYSDTLILHSTTTTYSILIFPKKINIPRKCFYDFPKHKKHREIEYVGQKSVIAVCGMCPYLMRKIKTSIGKIITPLSRVYHICSTTQHTITIQYLSCQSSNGGLHHWLAATSQTECVRSKIRRVSVWVETLSVCHPKMTKPSFMPEKHSRTEQPEQFPDSW